MRRGWISADRISALAEPHDELSPVGAVRVLRYGAPLDDAQYDLDAVHQVGPVYGQRLYGAVLDRRLIQPYETHQLDGTLEHLGTRGYEPRRCVTDYL